MPTSSPDWLRGYPQSLRDTLDAALRGTLAPPIVLTRLFLALHDTARILSLLSEVVSDRRAAGDRDGARGIEAVHALALRDPTALDEMRRVLAILHGDSQSREATNPSAIATAFDKAAELSPAASVALYSLGDPALLQSATHELVALLRDRELISRRTRVLEIGCGIGRFAQALASEVTSFIGIDVSCNMIRLAEERCAGLPNVTLSVTSGNDLRDYLGASFDLVLAVDSFPYINAASSGLADIHINESARVLVPGGSLAIFNFSYEDDFDMSRDRLTRLAAAAGLDLAAAEAAPLRRWDGSFFYMRKQGRAA